MHLMSVQNSLYIAWLAEVCRFALTPQKRETLVLWYIVSSTDYKLSLKPSVIGVSQYGTIWPFKSRK